MSTQNIGNRGGISVCIFREFYRIWVERNERKSNFFPDDIYVKVKKLITIETMFPKRSHETELAKGRYILQSMKTTTK